MRAELMLSLVVRWYRLEWRHQCVLPQIYSCMEMLTSCCSMRHRNRMHGSEPILLPVHPRDKCTHAACDHADPDALAAVHEPYHDLRDWDDHRCSAPSFDRLCTGLRAEVCLEREDIPSCWVRALSKTA